MAEGKPLEAFADQIAQCVRCGTCQAHCPVYLETGREGSVARGKIVLAAAVLAGEVELDEQLRREIDLCLLCGSCVAKCPNQVPTAAIVAALRQKIVNAHGLSPLAKGVATLVGSRPLRSTLAKGAELLAPLLFKKIPATSGLRLRFAPAALKNRSLPPLPERNLLTRVPEFLQGDPAQPVVGVFAGCALTHLYPQVGEILARLPHRLGYSVYMPRSQGCCGMPALSSGNGPLVASLAEANISAFAGHDLDCILTACASCLGMLTASGAQTGQTLAAEPIDIHVFLHRQGLGEQLAALPRWSHRLRITYHDPCHLRQAGITREPRALLSALPQADLVEMEDASLCCGLGGTFTAAHPDLSRAIGDRKLAGLRASGATVIASACPGCILQLRDIIDRAGLAIKAVHTLELIHQALTEPWS
ncbi:MAG: (Fe-S)-binding protein [Proteobacteria bacterium]|nr:(Fe-S)-binding protein [Pseudomonadota bacterium]